MPPFVSPSTARQRATEGPVPRPRAHTYTDPHPESSNPAEIRREKVQAATLE